MPDKPPPPLTTPRNTVAQREQDKSILQRMDCANSAIRVEAMEECRQLPVQRIVGLMYALEAKTLRQPIFWERSVILGVLSSIGVLLGLGIVASASVLMCIAALLFIVFFACATIESIPTKSYSPRAADSLASVIEDIREPAFLSIALRTLYTQHLFVDYYALDAVPKALSRAAAHMLRSLSIEDIQPLVQQEALYWFLKPSYWRHNPITSVRVLNILEAIGTPAAIPKVQVIASEFMPSSELAPVKEAAQACLLVLKEREKESKLPHTLLRASAAPAPAADTLLRPANGSAENAPAQLLRAAAPAADE